MGGGGKGGAGTAIPPLCSLPEYNFFMLPVFFLSLVSEMDVAVKLIKVRPAWRAQPRFIQYVFFFLRPIYHPRPPHLSPS